MAGRLAAHGLHPFAIDGPGFGESSELRETLGDVIGEWAERVGIA
jgi:alpha-beta hydrolase superfamily lysophospholipase